MIVKTLGYSVTGSEVCPFTDVAAQSGSDPLYPAKYVAVCALRGITTGKSATKFDPGSSITHQQLITMVARAAGLAEPPAGYTPAFTAAQFSLADHYANARRAAYAGLLEGLQGMGAGYDFRRAVDPGGVRPGVAQSARPAGGRLTAARSTPSAQGLTNSPAGGESR